MVSIFLYTWPVWYLFTSKKNHASIESKWERIFLKHTKNDWSFPSFTKCYGGDNQKIKAENEEQECFWSSSFRGLVLLCNSLYKPVLQARQREGSTLENNGWSKSNYSWDFLPLSRNLVYFARLKILFPSIHHFLPLKVLHPSRFQLKSPKLSQVFQAKVLLSRATCGKIKMPWKLVISSKPEVITSPIGTWLIFSKSLLKLH